MRTLIKKKIEVSIKGKTQQEDIRSNRADESIDIMKIKSDERTSNSDRAADINKAAADRKVKGSDAK